MQQIRWGVLIICLVVSSGCLGAVLDGDDLVFESGTTEIDEQTTAETGYEVTQSDQFEFNETISIGDDKRTIAISQHTAIYQKTGGDVSGVSEAFVMIHTTPKVSIAGQELNPLLRMDDSEHLEEFLDETNAEDEFELTKTDSYSVSPFDDEATVTVYNVTDEGREDPTAYVHVLEVSPFSSEDMILAFSLYPAALHDEKQTSTKRLFMNLKYETN